MDGDILIQKEVSRVIGKLIRFEARSAFRLLIIVWISLLAIAGLISIILFATGAGAYQELMHGSTAIHIIDKVVNTLLMTLYVALFVAQIVLTMMVIVMRFYKGMLGDEGYLMHTLPVKEWELITSKGIIATLALIGSFLAGGISILMLVISFEPRNMQDALISVGDLIRREPIVILYIVESIILMLLSGLSGIYQIYASISIGQLVNRHRVAMSLAVYIGINMVLSTVGTVGGVIIGLTGVAKRIEYLLETGHIGPQILIIAGIVCTAAIIVIFHIITERMMSRRLNLL